MGISGNWASVLLLVISILTFLFAIVAASIMLFKYKRAQTEFVPEEGDAEEVPDEAMEEAVPAEDIELYRAGRLSYNKSFIAKYIQADDTVKEWYSEIKNELLSYEKIHSRLSWRKESFKHGKDTVARLAMRGKTLCLFLAVDPNKYIDSDYRVEDASDVAAYADTPCVYRVRSDQRLEYAFELIEDAMKAVGAERGESRHEDYYLPYQNLSDLIDKGLVKRVERA